MNDVLEDLIDAEGVNGGQSSDANCLLPQIHIKKRSDKFSSWQTDELSNEIQEGEEKQNN